MEENNDGSADFRDNGVAILPVTHGKNAAVMGAVSLVLHEVLTLNIGDTADARAQKAVQTG